jgi:D-amino peptidase
MKVFVAVDMEGVAGLVQWDGAEESLQRKLMTEEVNAAARGAFAAGATEVVAGESHGKMRNLLPELLDPRVSHLAGQPKPFNHMGGIDASFDVALFVGYHARAGALHGVMAHTFSGSVFSLSFNDVEVGEIGSDAALCGAHGVPVGLVAGDRAACEEARALLGPIQTVAVKEGLSRSSALCLPLDRARVLIEEGAAKAVRRAADWNPFVFEGSVTVRLVFTDPSYADTLEYVPLVTRVDGRTITFEASDYLSAFQWFDALRFLAPVVR